MPLSTDGTRAYSFAFVHWQRACSLVAKEGPLANICRCGSAIVSPDRALVCVRCRAACCPVCVYVFESANYCTRCAETLVDQRLASVGAANTRSSSPARPTSLDTSQSAEWIILVARDQGDLFSHLERAFARDSKVEIILDRRKDYRRNPPGVEERLRIHGAVVVRRSRPKPPRA